MSYLILYFLFVIINIKIQGCVIFKMFYTYLRVHLHLHPTARKSRLQASLLFVWKLSQMKSTIKIQIYTRKLGLGATDEIVIQLTESNSLIQSIDFQARCAQKSFVCCYFRYRVNVSGGIQHARSGLIFEKSYCRSVILNTYVSF